MTDRLLPKVTMTTVEALVQSQVDAGDRGDLGPVIAAIKMFRNEQPAVVFAMAHAAEEGHVLRDLAAAARVYMLLRAQAESDAMEAAHADPR